MYAPESDGTKDMQLPNTECDYVEKLVFGIPSKFLKVYDFGMKIYSSQPIIAFLERKAEV